MAWYKEVEGDVRHHKKEILMVAGTLILVIFAYLAWRKSKGGSTPLNATSGVTGYGGEGIDQTGIALANAIKSQTGLYERMVKQLEKANHKLRNLNKKEHREIVHTKHLEEQLRKLRHAQSHDRPHPTSKHAHSQTHRPGNQAGRSGPGKHHHAHVPTGQQIVNRHPFG